MSGVPSDTRVQICTPPRMLSGQFRGRATRAGSVLRSTRNPAQDGSREAGHREILGGYRFQGGCTNSRPSLKFETDIR